MTKPKTRKQAARVRTKAAIHLGEWIRYVRTGTLDISQGDLAKRLHVARSTVSSWESGDYQPAAGKLVELGNLLPYPDCMTAWSCGGVDLDKLQYEKTPPAQGVVRLPLVEIVDAAADSPKGTWDIPSALVNDPALALCARLSGGLFPFASGDVLAVDGSAASALWELLGELVVVQFTRYPERLGPELLSQSQIERMNERATRTDQALLEKSYMLNRSDAGDAAMEKLAKRWAPDEHGLFEFQQIQAGWLRLEIAGYPDFAVHGDQSEWPDGTNPWRLGLQGAKVPGVAGGPTVPLTGWATSNWRDHPPIRLMHNRILGRVISWMKPAARESAPPKKTTQPRRETK